MRLLGAAALISVLLLTSAVAPPSHYGKQDTLLLAENQKLRKRFKRVVKKLRKRERLVTKLRRANRQRVSFGTHGVVRGFLCIHTFEGAWNAATGNGYHGGLQMDRSFMSSYGPNFLRAMGGAENWPPFVQVAVALNAYYSGRGYYPWPNTARKCGLL